MSTEETPSLLARERNELEAVVTPLREKRRVVAFLVCNAKMRPVVLAHLRETSGVSIPEPVPLVEANQTLDVLVEASSRGADEVRSLLVVHDAPDVMRTLNWHREKLRRGASVLLWIEGVEGLRELRAMGPDAYSFRDVMVVVQGEEPVVVAPPVEEESVEIQLARLRWIGAGTAEERAYAAFELAATIRFRTRPMRRCAPLQKMRYERCQRCLFE